MVFSSVLFIFMFLPVVLAIYFLGPQKYRNLVLFISSLVFYGWGEPVYILIMLFSSGADYLAGRIIDQNRGTKIPKIALISSLVINLSLLGFFKYSNFFIDNLNGIFAGNISFMEIALPIGISFYTFQSMSYTIDLYRGRIGVQKNFISFGAYVYMFPQLVAGPIVTYGDVEKEINERTVTLEDFSYGIKRFIEGLGKKVLIANNIGLLVESIKGTELGQLSILSAWLGALAFGLQIYFDFSGYSDMAIGLGKMLGFNFPENFNYPYLSKSATEFWRRWHITLGHWFREYVYIPMGGNRKGKMRLYLNLMFVWFLTGFWHGAEWNFVLWGLYFGILIAFEKAVLLKWFENLPGKILPTLVSRSYFLIMILVSWVIFAFEDLTQGIGYLKVMFGLSGNSAINSSFLYDIGSYSIVLMLAVILSTPLLSRLKLKTRPELQYAAYYGILIISTAYLVSSTFNPFLYFRF